MDVTSYMDALLNSLGDMTINKACKALLFQLYSSRLAFDQFSIGMGVKTLLMLLEGATLPFTTLNHIRPSIDFKKLSF